MESKPRHFLPGNGAGFEECPPCAGDLAPDEGRRRTVEDDLQADADPVLVALCLAKTRADAASHYGVVMEERLKGPGSMRIPNVCQALGLEAIQLLEMFEREHFRF